jgi:hypothetical protein
VNCSTIFCYFTISVFFLPSSRSFTLLSSLPHSSPVFLTLSPHTSISLLNHHSTLFTTTITHHSDIEGTALSDSELRVIAVWSDEVKLSKMLCINNLPLRFLLFGFLFLIILFYHFIILLSHYIFFFYLFFCVWFSRVPINVLPSYSLSYPIHFPFITTFITFFDTTV